MKLRLLRCENAVKTLRSDDLRERILDECTA